MARTPTQWAFDYEDLQDLTGLSNDAVRRARSRGEFNPDMFSSIIYWVCRHGTMEVRRNIMEALLLRQMPKERNVGDDHDDDQAGRSTRLVPSPLEDAPKKKSAKKSRARP